MKNIFKYLFILCIMSIIISCTKNNVSNETSENNQSVIRVATPGTHPLFTRVNADGKFEGYDIDVWEEIGKRLNKKIEWHQFALEGCFGALDAGKVDTATQQISITPARLEKYIFSEPYFLSPFKLYVVGTNDTITKLEDLYGKRLALVTGSATHEYIKELDPENKIEIISLRADSTATIPSNVVNGKAEAAVTAVTVFPDLKESSGLDIKMVGDILFTQVNGFPFRKDEAGKKLCNEISKVVVEMREDGTLEKLAVKWFGYNPMEGLDAKTELDKIMAKINTNK
ncbi:transporter substrate-binding domain-containing protein [uncultured Brachyspira sp.]|uniref:transporter substrate-binding domain-containing protein n=1 Tax=uncultured Brachyspira sp. TaxID=221953 RepID=UPI00261B1027|nr:transporter substrate-binding domain-containing protein [uncultured Brachyspira sp.]